MTLDPEEILNESLHVMGEKAVVDDDTVRYGDVVVRMAPKEGKAITLLADQLFSPSLFIAERIERGLVPLQSKTVLELGAGCALPSLLASTHSSKNIPSLVVVTDHPDPLITSTLSNNVTANQHIVQPGCTLLCRSHAWGESVDGLLSILPPQDLSQAKQGYDILILSDLLHFSDSHTHLLKSTLSLLSSSSDARVYICAGKYTRDDVCTTFLREAERGVEWVEGGEDGLDWLAGGDGRWKGTLPVIVQSHKLDEKELGVRKGMCRWWVGRWKQNRI